MQTLVLIFGPAAAGKATVGQALSRLTGLPLLHNHDVAEPVAKITGWGGRLFESTMTDVRKMLLLATAAGSGVSLITTFMWAFEYAPDTTFISWLKEARWGRLLYLGRPKRSRACLLSRGISCLGTQAIEVGAWLGTTTGTSDGPG